MNFKKWILATSSITAVATPVAVVISCGNTDNANTDVNKYAEVSIELSEVKSVDQLLNKLNEKLNIFMNDWAGNIIGSKLTPENNKTIYAYLDGIHANKTIKLKLNNKEISLDFTKLIPVIERLKDKSKAYEIDQSILDSKSGFNTAASNFTQTPEIVKYISTTAGVELSVGMTGFLQLGDNSPTTVIDMATNDYYQLLDEYHNIFWQLSQSELFKEWIQGKQYEVLVIQGDVDNPWATENHNNGEYADREDFNDKSIPVMILHGENADKYEGSNIELTWAQRVVNIRKIKETTEEILEISKTTIVDWNEVVQLHHEFPSDLISNGEVDMSKMPAKWHATPLTTSIPNGFKNASEDNKFSFKLSDGWFEYICAFWKE